MKALFPRRKFIQSALTAGVGSGVLVSSWCAKVMAALNDPVRNRIFRQGIASGDPTHDGVVLWTRITTEDISNVVWQLASDDFFTNILQQGELTTDPETDHTVKVEISNLNPGQVYFYRFLVNGITSEPGRTKTLPDGPIEKLSLAVASCSNYPFGYFNAYEEIAKDKDIDFVVHLGDYIYEYGSDGWGAAPGERFNRSHLPSHEIVSLSDYRERHAQYKSDRASRVMHASHPLIPTWDDHESANNPWTGGAQNHQSNTEGDWSSRREASLRAFFEWMPVREQPAGIEKEKLWRHFSFGNLATMTTLETRHTGRSVQVNYNEHLESIANDTQRDRFLGEVLGDPNRAILSNEMENFLAKSLADSVSKQATWRIIGNQIPIARTHVPDVGNRITPETTGDNPIPESHIQFSRLGELDLPLYLDTWDGYPAARQRFYNLCRDAGASDLIVLTGDSHAFWANELYDGSNQPMGVELGTTGITSPGDFENYGPEGAAALDKLVSEHNREVVWTDCTNRGFVKLILTPESARAEYIIVNTVHSEQYRSIVLRKMEIVKRDNSLAFDL